MNNRQLLLSIAFTFSLSAGAQDTFTFGTPVNPEGKEILVDRHGIVIDKHHTIPVMGEMHFSRVPANDWRREIRKMKAGGITVVATYCFWIHHEATEGQWDWSGNRNLHHFLEVCKEENMPVVLRIGPFCHGEVYQGGFPSWLVDKHLADKSFKLRSEGKGFLAAVRRFYSNIYAQANDMLWKHGGPVIGVQIENECRGPWSYYMTLKKMAVEIGFDTPFYTRTGWPKLNGGEKDFGEMLPLYGDYADGFWDRVLTDMPGDYAKAFIMKDTRVSSVIATETFGTNQDTKMEKKDLLYPYLTCELGGGMMPAYHRRINISGREAFPLAVCKLGSGSNLPGYYMYHGGTNPAPVIQSDGSLRTMAETQASAVTNYNDMPLMTYDFQAPLGEMGQLNETAFHETRWLHQFLADWGEELAVADIDTLSEHYARRGSFGFYNDYVRIINEQGTTHVSLMDWKYRNLTITTKGIQPFAKADDALYFITVKNVRRHQVVVNGKIHTLKLDKPQVVNGTTFVLLSPNKARKAFVIDGKMQYAKHDGILYKADGGDIVEEVWTAKADAAVETVNVKISDGLRDVKPGTQKVAAMPVDKDFESAAVWQLILPAVVNTEDVADCFLKINYKGDVARVYADGQLVEDNFWNGKSMLVRMSDLIGKKVELLILPMGKDYPIYLQKEQKAMLETSPESGMLSLDSIEILQRQTIK